MNNWLERTELLMGEDRLERFKQAHVLVVGVGGVGAYAAEMICRAGIGKMTIVDGDVVNPSNINRQLVALHSTIGEVKIDILAKRLKDINPSLELQALNVYLQDEKTEELLDNNQFDFIIDCIDTLSPKVHLMLAAKKRKIKIVSSMGAGARMDPSKVKQADLSDTRECTLAKAVRKRLARLGYRKGFPVVYTTEAPNREAVVLTENERNKKSTVGTISYMPPVFGCHLASYVIKRL